ncbi:MAG: RagB/SusD family nutrient uptake outer membrane protein, partial [Tannerella sp.]|nr:RagB/SusD family nutrient uptake outer membrane protein [Tannerella sp.]
MKRIYNILTIALMAFASSCNDYLETKPGDKYDDVAVWSDQTLAESFVFNIYMGIPYPFQWYVNASLVDEAIPVQNDGVVTRVLTSTMTPDDKGVFVDNWAYAMNNWWWNDLFSCIRACNLFFEKVSDIPFTTEKYRDRLVGEVHFLRGYFYYLLLAQYGGVPLLDYTFNIGDDYNVPRNTLKETVDFIVKDLDQAAGLLRESQPADKTRATEGAALALKSRVLLYAASDLFNSKASWSPGYSNPELVSYTDDNRQQRWEAVRQATEAVMNLGYKLYDADADRVTNFANIFLKNSDEQI